MSSTLDPAATTRPLLTGLAPGDRLEIEHEVKVGWRVWRSTTRGVVASIDRRRHGLHTDRNFDDKVYSDVVVLRRDDGELTTVTLDEFSVVRKLPA
jgi:hypothetical protein